MTESAKKVAITVVGGCLAFIGLIFVIIPGPAFLFLPVGLAILSLEYPLAKQWLKKCQRWMRQGAEQMDRFVAKCRK
ncbi:PGPGW domain-containing protein [Thalassotalea euphylliae]|uniref:PGPGW domain-containing protein n=1 Tax=Thalassotalea euphylliae TaxID=1655234 RepID=UPI003636A21E